MRLGGVLPIGGAIALLVAGLVHLDLYLGGYRTAGSVPDFGRSILANALVSGVVAVAVAARSEWFVRLIGIAVPVATLLAFTYTHTAHTFLGFRADGLGPEPQTQVVLTAEIAAIVLLAATFVPPLSAHNESGPVVPLGAAAAVGVALFVGFGLYWGRHYETSDVAGGPTTVAIVDFGFSPEALTVERGTTVTWTNSDSLQHSVAAGDGSFGSDALGRGTTFRFHFEAPGEYEYVCGIHPFMAATIRVAG